MHLGVKAALGDERVVRASLDDPPVLQDEDPVRVANGRDPVGHDEARSPVPHVGQVAEDRFFRRRVHRRQRVVEEQQRRVEREGARQRGALLLAA